MPTQLYEVPNYAERANQMYGQSANTYKAIKPEITRTTKQKKTAGGAGSAALSTGYAGWKMDGSKPLFGETGGGTTEAVSLESPVAGGDFSGFVGSSGNSVGAELTSGGGVGAGAAETAVTGVGEEMATLGVTEGVSATGTAAGVEAAALTAGGSEAAAVAAGATAAETAAVAAPVTEAVASGAIAEGAASGSAGGWVGAGIGALIGLGLYLSS